MIKVSHIYEKFFLNSHIYFSSNMFAENAAKSISHKMKSQFHEHALLCYSLV